MAHEITIKVRAFPYYVKEIDAVSGEEVRVEKIARRRETIEVDDFDYRRALRFDAIQGSPEGSQDPDVQEPGEFDVHFSTPEQIAEYIKTEKPSVDSLVTDVGDDAEVAQRVIDAENLATGQQPRQTLVDRLQRLIDASGA